MFDFSKFQKTVSTVTNNPIKTIAQYATSGISSLVSSAFPGLTGLINSGFSLNAITNQVSKINDNVGAPIKNNVVDLYDSSVNRLSNTRTYKTEIIEQNVDKTQPISAVYPPDITNSKYRLEMQFGEYVRPYYGQNESTSFKSTYTINFPLPPQLVDSHNLGWSNVSTGIVGLASNIGEDIGFTSIGRGLFNSNDLINAYTPPEGKDKSTSLFDRFKNKSGIVAAYGASTLAPAVVQGLGGVIGLIPNPFPGAYYVGPDLRSFQFSWLFVPESSDDSVILKEILKQIRVRTLSQPTDKLGAFLKYPEICRLVLHPSETFSDTFPIKECALTNVTIDYSPFGLSFHTDQTPTAIAVSLIFAELQPLFKTDIDNGFKSVSLTEETQWDKKGNSVPGSRGSNFRGTGQ